MTQNGCTDTTSCVAVTGVGLGNELQQQIGFRLFPNPTRKQVQLELPAELKQAQVTILDPVGRPVQQLTVQGNRALIQCDRLAAGMYIVQVQSTDYRASKTLMIVE